MSAIRVRGAYTQLGVELHAFGPSGVFTLPPGPVGMVLYTIKKGSATPESEPIRAPMLV
ncbi:hypothetical protein KDX23_22150 [Burkholderia vietnamiensis]|uniref:hypothetical protein n=1 Tax=Burkholderia vietnamiensis TaxID=60552 RepID=UPI001B911A00|nr:hypothetical protein [Burkholderia vietnamiensis]MBR8085443.1 hypothetical protein [Burkholderia vietnamiensis]